MTETDSLTRTKLSEKDTVNDGIYDPSVSTGAHPPKTRHRKK